MSINVKVTAPDGRKLTMEVDYTPQGPYSYWEPPDPPEINEVLWATEGEGDDERELSTEEIDDLMSEEGENHSFYDSVIDAAEEESRRLEVEAEREMIRKAGFDPDKVDDLEAALEARDAAERENDRDQEEADAEARAEAMHGDHASALSSAGMGDDDDF